VFDGRVPPHRVHDRSRICPERRLQHWSPTLGQSCQLELPIPQTSEIARAVAYARSCPCSFFPRCHLRLRLSEARSDSMRPAIERICAGDDLYYQFEAPCQRDWLLLWWVASRGWTFWPWWSPFSQLTAAQTPLPEVCTVRIDTDQWPTNSRYRQTTAHGFWMDARAQLMNATIAERHSSDCSSSRR
jgi:hypothetical protein